ncbi:MAG: threonylcarbamoyl-AMP synthase [Clostridia bacterium]|nr:threonylcarbamoyl-AMP synthase [Clostridia bacterium]
MKVTIVNTLILKNPSQNDINQAADLLKEGKLVVFPTETVYGLGASALDETAAARIYAAKGRPSDNPLIIHLADAEDAGKYAEISPCYEKLASLFMPGPLTVVLPKKACIPFSVTGGLDTVAVRVPSHPIAHKLLLAAGIPIAAPSANRSGRPSCTTVDHVIEDMSGKVDAILDGGESDLGLESTILLPRGDNEVVLLRPGAITIEMLTENGFTVSLDKAVTEKPKDNEKPLAPGMKYRHYAPKASLILLDGTFTAVSDFMKLSPSDPSVAFLCYDEQKNDMMQKKAIFLGSYSDSRSQAHNLFDALRKLDQDASITTVYAPLPSKEHIGLALYNRLLKAAGYTVKSL